MFYTLPPSVFVDILEFVSPIDLHYPQPNSSLLALSHGTHQNVRGVLQPTRKTRVRTNDSENVTGSQETRTKERGIVDVKRSQKKMLWNGSPMRKLRRHQLCVRKDEAEERDEPLQPPNDQSIRPHQPNGEGSSTETAERVVEE